MHNLKVATHDLAPTSDQLGGHVPGLPVPDGVLISDNDDDVFLSLIQNQREVFVVTMLMTQVQRYISQMRELKDLTLPLMVKAVAGHNKDMTQLIG